MLCHKTTGSHITMGWGSMTIQDNSSMDQHFEWEMVGRGVKGRVGINGGQVDIKRHRELEGWSRWGKCWEWSDRGSLAGRQPTSDDITTPCCTMQTLIMSPILMTFYTCVLVNGHRSPRGNIYNRCTDNFLKLTFCIMQLIILCTKRTSFLLIIDSEYFLIVPQNDNCF